MAAKTDALIRLESDKAEYENAHVKAVATEKSTRGAKKAADKQRILDLTKGAIRRVWSISG